MTAQQGCLLPSRESAGAGGGGMDKGCSEWVPERFVMWQLQPPALPECEGWAHRAACAGKGLPNLSELGWVYSRKDTYSGWGVTSAVYSHQRLIQTKKPK